ncbi:carbon monoxide dehydrogenase CooS [Thermoanaerobacter kivui]|uniref:Carbon monoxide dehydrogenase n=1 Tax=Thermoanaerobacter kivui TaxID=2325 RepID=A0A097AQ92_THEKI|nr:anaerobic carbon-monoxide dehydrogenase catalytic subunit [Thermoanaerobacter kivui]AIS51991.1 carbon monoxide dehydrogenase CooS [Thermoanaerobacter kivui]
MSDNYIYSAEKVIDELSRKPGFVDTAIKRWEKRDPKCGFGYKGICCRLCSNGPCRITPTQPVGICGATADTIVARNLLRAIAAGTSCYVHHCRNAANTLLSVAEGKSSYTIKDEEKLKKYAKKMGINTNKDIKRIAYEFATRVLNDLSKPYTEKAELVEKLSLPARVSTWKSLNIMPGGVNEEIIAALTKTSTNLNSDPVDMAVHCLRLGIITGIYGLELTCIMQDILLGSPKIASTYSNFGVIDQGYINLATIGGHQQVVSNRILEMASSKEWVKKAQEAGAKGFKIYGVTCVGQDYELRCASDKNSAFGGYVGNNFTQEYILGTGAIDLVFSEFNCTLPGIEPICKEYLVKQICLDDVAKKVGADLYQFQPEKADEYAAITLDEAIKAYKNRRGKVKIDVPTEKTPAMTGFTEDSIKGALGGSWKLLIDLIVKGDIKGVAGVVGCSNMAAKGHGIYGVELTKELIKRDILVLGNGCVGGNLENAGLYGLESIELAGPKLKEVCRKLNIPPVLNIGPCLSIGRIHIIAEEIAEELKVDVPQIPVVASAPQWLEEQALADGTFGVVLGLDLLLGTPPAVTGSNLITELLTSKLKDMVGARFIIEADPILGADAMESSIMERRKLLNI